MPDTRSVVVVGSGAAGMAAALGVSVPRGLEAGASPEVSLARDQESRIRRFHATLGEYLRA